MMFIKQKLNYYILCYYFMEGMVYGLIHVTVNTQLIKKYTVP